jgi:antitoxin HicB
MTRNETVAMASEEKFDVVLVPHPEGGFTVTVPEMPDVVTEAETREEALSMARDAIEGYLETANELGWAVRRGEHERVIVHLA